MPREDIPDSADSHALMHILEEKDKLIVSLKEAATKRDKLNESQIRLLSQDNTNKESRIKSLAIEAKEAEKLLQAKEAEAKALKLVNDEVNDKLALFRSEFEHYKGLVQGLMDRLKQQVETELSQKESRYDILINRLNENYDKLQNKLIEVENYYNGIMQDIASKQGKAKDYIRHAINDLQDALNYLDLSASEYKKPLRLKDEYERMKTESENMFDEVKESRGITKTVIENIENVNLEINGLPGMDTLINTISGSSAGTGLKQQPASPLPSQSGEREAGNTDNEVTVDDEHQDSDERADHDADSNISTDAVGQPQSPHERGSGGAGDHDGGAEKASAYNAPQQMRQQQEPSVRQSPPPPVALMEQPASVPAMSESHQKDTAYGSGGAAGTEHSDAIAQQHIAVTLDEHSFLAPFNWKVIRNETILGKYQNMIDKIISAESEGNVMKAYRLFRTLREQPTVTRDPFVVKLLDEQLEYIEQVLRQRFSIEQHPYE